jgi:hypothetical protein
MTDIFNAPTWSGPEAEPSAVFLTFDEDVNNLSLGVGNEGNHIVMIVIPNQAAIDNGMKGGAFTVDSQYDHYSLLHTIEIALSKPGHEVGTLTDNDKYAPPMNEFWK